MDTLPVPPRSRHGGRKGSFGSAATGGGGVILEGVLRSGLMPAAVGGAAITSTPTSQHINPSAPLSRPTPARTVSLSASATKRRPSTSSNSTSPALPGSIDFAHDRSPLQKLELELRNITQGEADAEGIARSLSRRQDSQHRRPLTSPTSPTRKPPVDPEDQPQDTTSSSRNPKDRSSSNHHHSHIHDYHLEMPHLFHRSKHTDEEDSKIPERAKYYKTASGAENFKKPQPTYQRAPVNRTAIESNNKVRTRHLHHFRHRNKQGHEGSGYVNIPTEHVGAGSTDQVARLCLEDMDAEGPPVDDVKDKKGKERRGNLNHEWDSRGPSAGTNGVSQKSKHRSEELNFPSSVDGPTDDAGARNGDRHHHHHHIHHEHDPEHPSHHHHPDHLQAPHTKEEREDELIRSYIRAIKPREVEDPAKFSPPLYVKCGPLLRYTGLRRDDAPSGSSSGGRETWRGSVMILCEDKRSTYNPAPYLRLCYADGTHKVRSGEGKYREVEAMLLHAEHGVTFWRFNIEVEMCDVEAKIAYRINGGNPIHFWIPAIGQTMNIMFHSCNGFSLSVNPDDFSGPDPLWNDVLEKHKKKPFHVMIGGGDQSQLYSALKCFYLLTRLQFTMTLFLSRRLISVIGFLLKRLSTSRVMILLLKWQRNWNLFTLIDTVCCFPHLISALLICQGFWFAQGKFGVANCQIPMVNIWDGTSPRSLA
jgi:hypothetical protein